MEQDQIARELRDIHKLMATNQAANAQRHHELSAEIHSMKLEMSKYKGILGGVLIAFSAVWTFGTFLVKTYH